MKLLLILLFVSTSLRVQGKEECPFIATKITTKLPTPRVSIQAVYDGEDTIYLVGGFGSNQNIQDILKFTISTEVMSQIGRLPLPLESFSLARDANNSLYIMRGLVNNGYDKSKDIYRFTPGQGDSVARWVGSFEDVDSNSASFQTDEEGVYIMGGGWGRDILQYDFRRNAVTSLLLQHPYCSKILPLWDPTSRSVIVICDKGPANNGAYVWRYDVDSNSVSNVLGDFPRFGDQPGASWDGEDAFIYANFGNELPYGGLLQYNVPSGNLTFIPVEGFPGTYYSPLRGAAAIHVPHLNRLYLFGGSISGSGPFFQDSIYHISLGCPKESPTTPTPITTTTKRPGQPDPVDCSNKPDGFYPHPYGCDMFVGCRFGEATEFTCPPPYLFDPAISTCNQPHLVDCPLSCKVGEDGLFPHPYDCSLVKSCEGGEMNVFRCPAPLLFDPVLKICNFPDLVNCSSE